MYQLLFLTFAWVAMAFGSHPPGDAIRLSDVQMLTLHADQETAHRRLDPIPQLRCVSHPSVCALHKIGVLRCTNQGSSYSRDDVEWTCTAPSLPSTLQLGSTDVLCEGYLSPDDSHVLKGSCGVEYQLALTSEGKRKHWYVNWEVKEAKRLARQQQRPPHSYTATNTKTVTKTVREMVTRTETRTATRTTTETETATEPSFPSQINNSGTSLSLTLSPSPSLFQLTCIAVIIWMAFGGRREQEAHRRESDSDGSRAANSNIRTAPTPFTPATPSRPPNRSSPTSPQTSSGPGFLTGLATGAAAGYMAGSCGDRDHNNEDRGVAKQGQEEQGGRPTFGTASSTGFGTTRRRTTQPMDTDESDSETSGIAYTPASSVSTLSSATAPAPEANGSSNTNVGAGSTRRR
ncbi:hypothetical protein OQA88_5175 [Cercophora sp. LCS_1]